MKTTKRTILAFALFCAAAIAASAQARPRLAILPFTGSNIQDAESIAEFFSFEPDLTRNFTVVPRTGAIETLMKEQRFQRSGLTDADTISELGKQMNADYVLAGHITALGAGKLLLITIIHVEELRQIAGDYKTYTRIEETEAFLSAAAKRIADASRRDTASLPRLAVLPLSAQTSGVNEADAEIMTRVLAANIANSGKYAVFPRAKAIETVMKEHNIERSGMTDPANIQRIGAAVNAQYLLSVNFRSLGSNRYFSTAIVDTENASQTEENRKQYKDLPDGLILMGELAIELTGTAAPPPAGFVRVQGGSFQMGYKKDGWGSKPVHSVTVKSYYIAKYELTQKEWAEIMGSNPSQTRGNNLPVEKVSWDDIVDYCNRRSLKEGLTPAYRISDGVTICDFTASGYRMPTEAEWEFAAKGGNKDQIAYDYSGSDNVDEVGWYRDNSGEDGRYPRLHPVGTKAPNSLGIYDMSGNIAELCWDRHGPYGSEAQIDPVGSPDLEGSRVQRGGSYVSPKESCYSTGRYFFPQDWREHDIGFRLARSAP